MRSLVVGAILIVALVSAHGIFAQTATPPVEAGKTAAPAPAGATAKPPSQAGASENIKQQRELAEHKRRIYRPCPASVGFPNGRNACLGCPTACRFHY
jgi:hypothetical protein